MLQAGFFEDSAAEKSLESKTMLAVDIGGLQREAASEHMTVKSCLLSVFGDPAQGLLGSTFGGGKSPSNKRD